MLQRPEFQVLRRPAGCLADYVTDYNLVGEDYGLSRQQKLQLLHHLLRGAAKRFYPSRLAGVAKTYQEAVAGLRAEYHSPVQQSQALNVVKSLRITDFTTKGMTEQQALAEVYETVSRTAKLVPPEYQGDKYQVDFLVEAVVGSAWADQALSAARVEERSLQGMYSALQKALFMSEEAKRARIKDKAIHGAGEVLDSSEPSVLFQGQGRYAVRPSSGGFRPAGPLPYPKTGQKRFNPLSIMGCFNCDDPGHTVNRCPVNVDLRKAAAKRMEYAAKRNAGRSAEGQVLYALCAQLEDAPEVAAPEDEVGEEEAGTAPARPDVDGDTLFASLEDASHELKGSDVAAAEDTSTFRTRA